MSDRDMPELYRMSTFVKLTGVSPDLLRAWERRHKLLEPERSSGGHREYTEDDRRVIERVLALLEEGRTIGEIARIGRERLLAGARSAVTSADGARPETLRDRLITSAIELDERAIQNVLDEAFALMSPIATVEGVIVPSAQRVGDLWERGELSVASEHLLSSALEYRLLKLIELASVGPRVGSPVICACFPEEAHELGLLVVALYLAGRGKRISYLGRALPAEDLDRAISRVHPSAVCLSVAQRKIFERHVRVIAGVAKRHREIVIYIGGAGVPARSEILARAGVELVRGASPAGDFVSKIELDPAR